MDTEIFNRCINDINDLMRVDPECCNMLLDILGSVKHRDIVLSSEPCDILETIDEIINLERKIKYGKALSSSRGST